MAEDQDFQARMAGIQALLRQLEKTSDPALRASVKELMQSVMELHGTAVNRMMEIAFEGGAPGEAFIQAVGEDPLTSSLLILHGLHPETTAARVARAIDAVVPVFRKHGADVELESVDDTVAHLRIRGSVSASAGRALKTALEERIYALAPDITRLEGLNPLGAAELIGIETLAAHALEHSNQLIGVALAKGGD